VPVLEIQEGHGPLGKMLSLSVSLHLVRCAFTARIALNDSDRRGEDIEGLFQVFNGLWGVWP
jgi:hypothetical protein